LIWVDRLGQNSIVVAPGANHAFVPADVEGLHAAFHGARFVLFQLETPLETVEAALRMAKREGSETILDPAPAQPLAPDLLASVDILTPNETEASILLGLPPGRITMDEASGVARALRELGPNRIVLKLGDQG